MQPTGPASSPTQFADVVANWQRRLLQLDRWNNLLYFRPGRTAVHVVEHTPDSIIEALSAPSASRHGLSFDYEAPKPRRRPDNFDLDNEDDEELDLAIPGDLSGDCPTLELQRRLRNLRRRAREWEEEQGLSVLFLALGFLNWVDEDGQTAASPLLMLPVNLESESPRSPFVLHHDDDEDFTTNSTLAVKLNEFGIKLLEDPEIETVARYLDSIKELVRQRPGWNVNEEVYLAIFAYSKLAMWRDLEDIKNNGADNSIVKTMAGAESPHQEDATGDRGPGARLDDLLDVRDQFAVLPADYSQVRAITAARSGHNLVLHGPPGTGKSQTIANITATLLAEGKSVLFVSEKTAALDVVKSRLDERRLGVFCLDLHSERGRKASVYQQLRGSVDDRREVRLLEFAYEALAERRDRLNQVVRALHQVRQPLGRTAFQVHGSFADVREAPDVPFAVNDIETLDQARLVEILEAADRIRLRPREFTEHRTSHWRVLKGTVASLELADKIRRDMQTVSAAVEAVRAGTAELAESLGFPLPETLGEAAPLLNVTRSLVQAPGVPRRWLGEGVVERLLPIAERESLTQSERGRLVEQLAPWFGEPIPNWDFAHISPRLAVSPVEAAQLKTLLGAQWTRSVLWPNGATSGALRQISDALLRLKSVAAQVADFLRSESTGKWAGIQDLLHVAQAVGQTGPVPASWVEPGGIEAAAAVVEMSRQLAQDLDRLEERVFPEFEPEILEVVDRDMLTRYRTDYQSKFRRIMPGCYRSDRRAIRAFHRVGGKLTFYREQQLVGEIVDLKRQQDAWRDLEAELVSRLESRQAGRNTNWEAAHRDIGAVRELLNGPAGNAEHVRQLLTSQDDVRRSLELAEALAQALAEVKGLVDTHLSADLAQQVREGILLPALEGSARQAAETARRIEGAAHAPLASACREIPDLSALQGLMSVGVRLRELEQEQSEAEAALRSRFGRRYAGFDTDWHEIRNCLAWTSQLLVQAPPDEVTPTLAAHAENPREPSFYESEVSSIERVLQQTRAQLDSLLDDYDLQYTPFDSSVASWEQAKFHQIIEWAGELSRDADSAGDWLTYKAAVADLDRLAGPSTTGSIRDQIDNVAIVPRIVQRRIWTAWLDWLYFQEPLLGRFAAPEQEDLIARFKELDVQLADAAQDEVRRRVFEKYPNFSVANNGASEPGILRGELSKRRRQWPVRRLFERVPRVIQTLKPCILVSPLAVSQYLPLALDFDVVIFDEPSQVFPEDAISAILRGRQLVLAGDQKQLPPSNFFRSSASDEEYDDDDEADDGLGNQLAGRESILDTAVGLVGRTFTEEHLNVHYRSRDEGLIRFSNHYFYDDRLITFPSPDIGDSWNGVHDVYVPEGRYDAGATRTNRVEADRVVDLVFRHFRTRPEGESLGVVALSRAQADLIEQLIEERRIRERDVEGRFSEMPDEPFSVKNLENVQGDERDHIIISVGYGPTVASGAVPNRFGPINSAGGERRLNVVVSRAKQRIDLVHSLRATDINSEQAGARLLRRYLEYAAVPRQTIEAQAISDPAAETESPFEEAVEQALIAREHRVARQIGVSVYRIDLAILSEDGDAFDLGIECDGWRYHSVPAARDRDWLRQQVLEGLGWRIHRVWSAAWVRNPEAELARIEEALKSSRSQSRLGTGLRESKAYSTKTPETQEFDHETVSVVPEVAEVTLVDYKIAPLARRYREDLLFEKEGTLVSLVEIIARDEGPVHQDIVMERIRGCYGISRLGKVTREKIERGIQLARSSGAVQGDGSFVWHDDGQLSRQPRRLEDRKIEHVHLSELQSLILAMARALFGTTRNGLITEVARHLGFRRNGSLISEAIDTNVQQLIENGQLVEEFNMVRLTG